MGGRIVGAPMPPAGPRIQVVTVTWVQPKTFVILSTAVFGQMIHWYGNRSHECTAMKSACNGCQRGWPQKTKGYLYACEIGQRRPVILELTPTAIHLINEEVPEGENFRGWQIKIGKTGGGKKGRFQIEVKEMRFEEERLAPEIDPYPVLKFLWVCKNPSVQKEPLEV
jgi:hypothetical protein